MTAEQRAWLDHLYDVLNQAPKDIRFSMINQGRLRPLADIDRLKSHEKDFMNPQLDLELKVVSNNSYDW